MPNRTSTRRTRHGRKPRRAGVVVAAWLGAGYLSRIPKMHMIGVIAVLRLGTAAMLAVETLVSSTAWLP
jgi:hypothetical protein